MAVNFQMAQALGKSSCQNIKCHALKISSITNFPNQINMNFGQTTKGVIGSEIAGIIKMLEVWRTNIFPSKYVNANR